MVDGAIRIVVIDDHALMREGLTSLLKRDVKVEVVAEGAVGQAAKALVAKHKPDVLLLDLMLRQLDGMDVVSVGSADGNVIGVSMRNDGAFVLEAFRKGAAGYVLKEDSSSELLDAIRTVHRGERYLSR